MKLCSDSEFAREKKLPERSHCGQGEKDELLVAEGWPVPVLPPNSCRNLAGDTQPGELVSEPVPHCHCRHWCHLENRA